MPGPEQPARLSPPTDRVLDVLEAVAGAPGRGWSVGELARHTGLTKSTCLGIVNALLARSYLVRLDATVALGPGFARLRGAVDSDTALERVARPHLAALARDHGSRVALSTGRPEGVTVIAAEGEGVSALVAETGGVQPWVATGMTYVAYVAWSPDEIVASRLEHLSGEHDADWFDQAWALVARCRADGYCAMQVSSTMLRLYYVIATLQRLDVPETVRHEAYEAFAEVSAHYGANGAEVVVDGEATLQVYAPVFGPRPDAAAAILAAYTSDVRLGTPGCDELVAATRLTAAKITADLGGRDPWRQPW